MSKYKIACISVIALILLTTSLICIANHKKPDFKLYYQLEEVEQELYELIYTNLSKDMTITTPEKEYTTKQIQNVRDALYYDCPELYKYNFSDVIYRDCKIEFPVLYSATEQAEIQRVLDGLRDLKDPIEIYNWCVSNIEYIKEDSYTRDNHTVYGALINKKAVCEGIARTYSLLLTIQGYPNTTVSNSNHMWNYVWHDNTWIAVDITAQTLNASAVTVCTVSEGGKIFSLPDIE